ncbi:MAG: nitrite reductase [Gammaproteobacteria bacterium]|nr:nitrite reductase [Gammaproteobacteria bacterium]MBU1723949.1 nitrite reductase [Gammaproteobacteria bacterium]MBU2007142.1 nitrite reductase [Gammaproteobacteria bacterium]
MPVSILLAACYTTAMAADASLPESLYQTHCASCHGQERLGLTGPALLPDNLGKLKKEEAFKLIRNGRVATQMQGFAGKLDDAQIQSLADYVFTQPDKQPDWGEADIRASRITYPSQHPGQDTPVFKADPLNLFLVVEAGDHHVSVLDGDSFAVIHRFPSRFSLHGGPKYDSTGRFVYFTSRDGWISKFDLYRLETVAEVRAGINARNAAISSDGKYLMVGNYLPNNLVVLDAQDLSLVKIIDATDGLGKSSRISAVYDAQPRKSFIAALKDSPEVWEISYGDTASAGFPIRRIRLETVLDDFFFDQDYALLLGASRKGQAQVIDLNQGKVVAKPELSGMPHLSSGIIWKYRDTNVLATPDLKEGVINILDMSTWAIIKKIKTDGPGFFMRSHENTPYAWTDVFFGEHKDVMHVIDKQSLEIVKSLRPAPGKTSSHVEFTRDGSHALVSIWEMDGAIVVYDSKTLEEVKRIPMKKPVGKYNVYNKINRSSGTSH